MTEADASEKRQREFIERSEMFQTELDVDETLAQLLVAEGFGASRRSPMSTVDEIAWIEGFDEELAAELQSRATEALERREAASREERRKLGVEDALAEMPYLTEQMLVTLGKAGIRTLDDLADLATDELIQKKRVEPRRQREPSNRPEDKGGVLAEYGLTEEQGNEIIMAARAHWFEDEDAGHQPRRTPMPRSAASNAAALGSDIGRLTRVPSGPACSPAARRAGRADPACLGRRTARSRRTCAPVRPAAARGSASTAPSSMRPTPRASSRARCQRAFKTGDVAFPPISASGSRRRCARPRSTGSGMEARAGNLITGAERIEAAARSGKVAPAAPRRRCRRGRAPQARPGLARRRRRGAGLIFPEPRTILSLALGRENVVHVALTDPAAASRVSHALARWRAFNDPDLGLEGGEPASGPGSAEEFDEGLG